MLFCRKIFGYAAGAPFPVNRRFGDSLPLSRPFRALLAKAKSTPYGDLEMKALLNFLVSVRG